MESSTSVSHADEPHGESFEGNVAAGEGRRCTHGALATRIQSYMAPRDTMVPRDSAHFWSFPCRIRQKLVSYHTMRVILHVHARSGACLS